LRLRFGTLCCFRITSHICVSVGTPGPASCTAHQSSCPHAGVGVLPPQSLLCTVCFAPCISGSSGKVAAGSIMCQLWPTARIFAPWSSFPGLGCVCGSAFRSAECVGAAHLAASVALVIALQQLANTLRDWLQLALWVGGIGEDRRVCCVWAACLSGAHHSFTSKAVCRMHMVHMPVDAPLLLSAAVSAVHAHNAPHPCPTSAVPPPNSSTATLRQTAG
jgi:hypothetical protein